MACFAVFKHGTTEEVAQLCFELIKMASFTPGGTMNTEYISRDHVQGYIERFINVSNPLRRLTKEEITNLNEAFNRIQDRQVNIIYFLNQVLDDN